MEPCPETLKWGRCLGLSLPTCIWSNDPPSIHSFLSWLQGSGFRKGEHCHHVPLSLHVSLPVYALDKSHYFICHFLKNQNWLGIFVIYLYLEKQTFFTPQLLAQEGLLGKEGEPHGQGTEPGDPVLVARLCLGHTEWNHGAWVLVSPVRSLLTGSSLWCLSQEYFRR